jgi:hypothetical protein
MLTLVTTEPVIGVRAYKGPRPDERNSRSMGPARMRWGEEQLLAGPERALRGLSDRNIARLDALSRTLRCYRIHPTKRVTIMGWGSPSKAAFSVRMGLPVNVQCPKKMPQLPEGKLGH